MRNEMEEKHPRNRWGRFLVVTVTSSLVVKDLRKLWLISSDTTHSRYVLTCVASIITHNLGYVDFLGFSGK